MESEKKLYEVAYLISPALTEEEAKDLHQKTKNMVLDLGGLIDHEGEVKKRRLSYPIQKMSEAFLAYFRMTLPANQVAAFKEALNKKEILRFLLINTRPIPLRQSSPRIITKTIVPESTLLPKAQPLRERIPETPAADVEEIDKKLEEILGK